MDEVQLVKSCQQGDMAAFNELYKRYSQQAFRTAYLITGNKHFAEDIVQEAFIKCYNELHRLKDPKAFKAWFYRILTNLCHRLNPKELQHESIDEMSEKGVEVFCTELGIEDHVVAKDFQRIIHQAVNSLEPSLKTVIILYYFNDFSIKEISKVTKCFEGTVKSRLYYGRKYLMKIISSNGLTDINLTGSDNRKEYNFYEKASLL